MQNGTATLRTVWWFLTKLNILLPYDLAIVLLGIYLNELNTYVYIKVCTLGFPGGVVVENLPANAGDTGSSPGLGRSHMPRSN